MAVITISEEMGSGGAEIGALVAAHLGYRHVDPAVIAQVAQQYGVPEARLADLDETTPGLLERFAAETGHYLTVLQCAILDLAEPDEVVIIGRSGQVLLQGVAHALRIFVRAPLALRAERVQAKLATVGQETVDTRTVADTVRRADQAKVGRMRYLFGVDWRDPALYDLVVDTERVTFEAVVEAIVTVVRRSEFVPTEASRQVVRDRALASQVRAALATEPETRRERISVTAERGVIRLESTGALERATAVTRTVPGVMDVRPQLLEVPTMPTFIG
jgi:cytidylate kinase